MLLVAIVWCLLFAEGRSEPPQCCGPNVLWLNNTQNCNDGGIVQMDCSLSFLLQTSIEPSLTFTFVEEHNETWLVLNDTEHASDDWQRIPSNEYCVTKSTQVPNELVALVCFTESPYAEYQRFRELMFGFCGALSSLFLFLTFCIYVHLPELREVQDKAITSMVAAFAVAFFFSSNLRIFPSHSGTIICVVLGFAMYYAYMCAFFWLNIISFNIWKSVWYPSCSPDRKFMFLVYSLVGWLTPLAFLLVAVACHHGLEIVHPFNPGMGEIGCWFAGKHSNWLFFYGPVLCLLCANLVYLALTSYKLWHQYSGLSSDDDNRLNTLRLKCCMYLKLAFLMGFTWLFEIGSFVFGDGRDVYWLATDVLNALQGIIMFYILVLSRNKVKKALATRRPLGINFPRSWLAYDEQLEKPGPIELELSIA
ncbi:G-protein coupled receptor Mth2-like [Trichogramma pretiosum]|uniref:G-protein coupled receptor Mth2-like n=1 Tax=Trichogramma pretiosum TaxID=7493 RepID=UPI0006C94C64|nr:G-protein coupled receptor Mth2-like [Trichogramma pretiosum]XP_023317721.1 G-protein coupled receptor Mth2-like [Trichogramma pretiosum]